MENIKHLGNNISLLHARSHRVALWAWWGHAVRFTKVNRPTGDQMNYKDEEETQTP